MWHAIWPLLISLIALVSFSVFLLYRETNVKLSSQPHAGHVTACIEEDQFHRIVSYNISYI